MPYGHLIAATAMTLGVCQGHSSIASFSILTSASCHSRASCLLIFLAITLTYFEMVMYCPTCIAHVQILSGPEKT